MYKQACGSKGFPGKGFSHERALEPQLRRSHLPRALPWEHRCHKAERSWSYESPGARSSIPAGCKQRLLGVDGWSPVPSPTRQEPAGADTLSAGTHGRVPRPQPARHSWEERGRQTAFPSCAPAVPRRWTWGQGRFGWRGNGHGPTREGPAFPMATRQLGVWLNCSAVAKEPRCSQETDGYA